jgi:SAM-dependent methyltransferase
VTSTTGSPATLPLTSDSELLARLADIVGAGAPLPGLDPDSYARDHAEFEQRSDQRELIVGWLSDRITRRTGPVSVLSVGCGDGQVDAAIAERLTHDDHDREVRYVGIEPFDGSASRFAGRMNAIGRPGLSTDVHVAPFHEVELEETFDVITFVHSLYYVPDVEAAVRDACRLLKPGGELLLLSAPRGVLNQLVGVLAPPVEGHQQWFSDDVSLGLAACGADITVAETGTLEAVVDLTDADDDVLDFTVQAQLTDQLRSLVRAYLAEVSTIDELLAVPHPVDTYVVTPGA